MAEHALQLVDGTKDVVEVDLSAIERVIIAGDLAKLTADERWEYYKAVCRSVSLNPFTKPFEYITLNNKLTLYALKGATDQLRSNRRISIPKPTIEIGDGLITVTATAIGPDGRTDSDVGIVALGPNVQGEARANAVMKAVTKAKRRVTLSFCGLGMLDESEAEGIPIEHRVPVETVPPNALAAGQNETPPRPERQPCDKKRWLGRWHVTVAGTRFRADDVRHKFIGYYSNGEYESLSKFLDDATDDEAAALITRIERVIAKEAEKAAQSSGVVVIEPGQSVDAALKNVTPERADLNLQLRAAVKEATDLELKYDVPVNFDEWTDERVRETLGMVVNDIEAVRGLEDLPA